MMLGTMPIPIILSALKILSLVILKHSHQILNAAHVSRKVKYSKRALEGNKETRTGTGIDIFTKGERELIACSETKFS